MPIAFSCRQCNRRFRVAEHVAGKRIKCPQCSNVLKVPAPNGSSVESSWYVKTEDGKDYGPVFKKELDTWVREGRLTATCQILLEGSPHWQWATDLYPQLASAPRSSASSDSQLEASGIASPETKQGTAGDSQNPFDFAALGSSVGGAGATRGRRRRGRKSAPSSGMVTAIAIVNFILGGLQLLAGIMVAVLGSAVARMLSGVAEDSGRALAALGAGIFVAFGVVCMAVAILRLLAGYGLIQRAAWGRILCLVLDVLGVMASLLSLSAGNLAAIPFLAYTIFALAILLNPRYAAEFATS